MIAMCWVPLLALLAAPVAGSRQELSANPVRKVVTLLQKMQKSVEAEGDREKELYDKFMCYCQTNKGGLEKSIADAEAKVEQLTADIEASEAEKAKTVGNLDEAKKDRADAKAALQAAKGIREKEAADFAKFQADSVANIGAIVKAVAALEKGVAGAFLQTSAAGTLRTLLSDASVSMPDYDRQQVMSFLSGNPFSQGYAPQSGQIIGILKQMGDEMATALAEATHEEEKAIHIYDELVTAKTDEINALTKRIEDKLQKNGELAVMVAEMKNDLGDTTESLAEDKKFLAELEKGCSSKTAEWEARCKVRQEELLALAETIKLLNDDDALELFKKTLPAPSASFLEIRMSAATVRSRARAILEQAGTRASGGNSMLAFIEYALSGKKIGFEKVITMIDEMVATLKKEQEDDDSKKEYCSSELDTSDDKKKALEKHISDTEAGIASTEEAIATTTQEIAELIATIKALDEQVSAATEQRKEENADYKQLMTEDTAAKELLKMALNRLNKFYNPKLYVPPAKVERSTMTAISEDMALSQIAAHGQKVAPPPPPETFGAYAKKTEEHGGVVQMIGLLIADLDKEMTEAETQEKDSQADYESLMKESAEKRASDSKSLSDKQSAKAELEGELQKLKGTLKEGKEDLAATLKYIHDLHVECDWLLKYYDVRKEMRASEVDALGKARAVLSGADYSLL
jgi:septal ring factor EnvC (AmiA/AmiB activator)